MFIVDPFPSQMVWQTGYCCPAVIILIINIRASIRIQKTITIIVISAFDGINVQQSFKLGFMAAKTVYYEERMYFF